MTEFTQLIEKAREVSHDSWVLGLFIVCVILLLAALYALRIAVVAACFLRREWIAGILHPRNFPKGSVWQGRAEILLAWLDGLAWPERVSAKVVSSPMRDYELGARIATGDVCDVYSGRSGDRSYILKVSRVTGGDRLLDEEHKILHALQKHGPGNADREDLPVPVEMFRSGHRVVSTFDGSDGFITASEVMGRTPQGVDAHDLVWILGQTLKGLDYVHEQGWIHGAVLPPHVLLNCERCAVLLVGWTHAVRVGCPVQVVSRAFRPWYPPECFRRTPATPATDIYLAAKSMVWLAGGDPRGHSVPDYLPSEIQCVLQECLATSPSVRPQNAGTLQRSFCEAMDRLYGPHSPNSTTMKGKGANHGYHSLVRC